MLLREDAGERPLGVPLRGAGVLLRREVEIPARVVGHGTFDKRRLACTFIHHFLFWITLYALMGVLLSQITPLFPDPPAITGGMSWLGANLVASV